MILFLHSLWKRSKNISSLHFYEKIFFYSLCFLELFYRAAFFCSHIYKKSIGYSKAFPFKVFSVGNLSAGGTGKSVFSRFLIDSIPSYYGAVVLRGYKGNNEKKGISRLISNGKNIIGGVSLAGDEAYMLARSVSVPVVVGCNRNKSCALLHSAFVKKVDYVVLDDAYQNYALKKDVEIVLLDARKPFENGHCFPAGRLREKDLSRADIVILTHADSVQSDILDELKKKIVMQYPYIQLFTGRHALVSIFDSSHQKVSRYDIIGKKFVASAGIASFSSFIETLQQEEISFYRKIEFEDHHTYSLDDIVMFAKIIKNGRYDALITTAKDWYKIEPLLSKLDEAERFKIFWLDVTFAFLTVQEHEQFFKFVRRVLEG